MTTTSGRPGRPSATTRGDLERVALRLFHERGFEATTVDDVAEAAGIGRRTFFRYFASKNDVVWGEFEEGLVRLRTALEASADLPLLEAVKVAVLTFNYVPEPYLQEHRQRMTLILNVPTLQAHSTLRYAAWRNVIADFAAARVGQPPQALLPQLIGHTCLGAALTAYEQWLSEPAAPLAVLLDEALSALDGTWCRL